VKSVSVERSWPGTVRIRIVERTPLAVLPGAGGTTAVVDSSGRVLADRQVPGLVRIDAVAPAPAPGQQVGADGKAALAVAAALPDDARGRVSSISHDPDGLVLHLRDKGAPIVRFGTDDALGPKIVALTTMLAKLDLADAAVIDVRVPAAPVLTRRSSSR
jgi:cell division protein FtsQ